MTLYFSAILRNHLIDDILCTGSVTHTKKVTTLEKEVLVFEKMFNSIVVNKVANITTADIVATNGVIHMIDQYIIPDRGNGH